MSNWTSIFFSQGKLLIRHDETPKVGRRTNVSLKSSAKRELVVGRPIMITLDRLEESSQDDWIVLNNPCVIFIPAKKDLKQSLRMQTPSDQVGLM